MGADIRYPIGRNQPIGKERRLQIQYLLSSLCRMMRTPYHNPQPSRAVLYTCQHGHSNNSDGDTTEHNVCMYNTRKNRKSDGDLLGHRTPGIRGPYLRESSLTFLWLPYMRTEDWGLRIEDRGWANASPVHHVNAPHSNIRSRPVTLVLEACNDLQLTRSQRTDIIERPKDRRIFYVTDTYEMLCQHILVRSTYIQLRMSL